MPPEGDTVTTSQADDTSPALTQEQLNQLPQWARESLTKANSEAAKYRTERNTLQQELESVGGLDRIKHLHWSTTTRDGIKSLFDELSEIDGIEEILGISDLGDTNGAPAAAATGTEPPVTDPNTNGGAATNGNGHGDLSPEKVQELIDQRVKEALDGVTEKSNMEQLRKVVTDHLKTKGYTDEHSFSLITQLSAKHQADTDLKVDPNDPWDTYLQAVDRGIEDFETWKKDTLGAASEEAKQTYLKDKANDAATTPTPASGTTPATGEKWDPSELSWDELTKEAQAKGYFD